MIDRNVQFGTDPEFFISDGKGGFVSASEVFPQKHLPITPWASKKGAPYFSTLGTKLFRDGFGVEVNVLPRVCRALLAYDVRDAILDLNQIVKEKNERWEIVSAPMVRVPLEYIESLPEDVQRFGCDPAWNAYTERKEGIELNGRGHPFRYGGGHLHFGFIPRYSNVGTIISCDDPLSPELREKEAFSFIKLFDLTIGLPLSIIFNDEGEFMRREYYGKAGEFRFQPWGIEYRTPSPRVWNHVVMSGLAFGVGRHIVSNYKWWKEKWAALLAYRPSLEEDLQRAINKGEGGEDLIQEISYFYDKKTINWLKKDGKEIFKLMDLSIHKLKIPNEEGYGNFMLSAKAPMPGKEYFTPDDRWRGMVAL